MPIDSNFTQRKRLIVHFHTGKDHFDEIISGGKLLKLFLWNRDTKGKYTEHVHHKARFKQMSANPDKCKTIMPNSCSSGTGSAKIALGGKLEGVCVFCSDRCAFFCFELFSCWEREPFCISLEAGGVWITPPSRWQAMKTNTELMARRQRRKKQLGACGW